MTYDKLKAKKNTKTVVTLETTNVSRERNYIQRSVKPITVTLNKLNNFVGTAMYHLAT